MNYEHVSLSLSSQVPRPTWPFFKSGEDPVESLSNSLMSTGQKQFISKSRHYLQELRMLLLNVMSL